MGYTYHEIATAIGAPTANAARMSVTRGIVKLTEALKRRDIDPDQ